MSNASEPLPQSTPTGPRADRRKAVIAWLGVAVWTAAIQTLGGDTFSNDGTSRFLGPLLHWLFPGAGPELLANAQFLIRKSAHVFEYAVLALLALHAWRSSFRWPLLWIAAASLCLVILVAGVDESRQARSTEREGAAGDVALDGFGGALGLIAGRAATRWWNR